MPSYELEWLTEEFERKKLTGTDKCDHCGRTSMVYGQLGNHLLCHANFNGTKANPDCYHLVTVGYELLGSRKP